MRYAASSIQFGPWRAALDARARHTGRPAAILAPIGISVACVTPYHSRLESFEVAMFACTVTSILAERYKWIVFLGCQDQTRYRLDECSERR